MCKRAVHLWHGDGCATSDKLHSMGFCQVTVWFCFDTDIEDVEKTGLLPPESSQELVVSRFNSEENESSDYASWFWSRRYSDSIEGSAVHRGEKDGFPFSQDTIRPRAGEQ